MWEEGKRKKKKKKKEDDLLESNLVRKWTNGFSLEISKKWVERSP